MAKRQHIACLITLMFLATMGTQVCCCAFHHEEYTPCVIGSSIDTSESCDCGPCPNISAFGSGLESQSAQLKGTYLVSPQWGP